MEKVEANPDMDLNFRVSNQQSTLLIVACSSLRDNNSNGNVEGKQEVVAELLRSNIDLAAKNSSGDKPLT